VHFSQLAIIASFVNLAIGYAERGGQRTISAPIAMASAPTGTVRQAHK
jgi:hypothetical protein